MSHGIKLLVALCGHATGFKDYLRLQPSVDDFKGEAERITFGFVNKFATAYGVLPQWQTVLDEGHKQGWEFALPEADSSQEPPQFYYEKVASRRVHDGLKASLQGASTFLNAGNPHGALEYLLAATQALGMRENKNRIINYSVDALGIVQKNLLAIAQGLNPGLKMGWSYLDGMSGGLVAGDVVSIIGRPAQGKTFAMLYAAHHGWKTQQRVPLVISMEMNNTIVTQRMVAMDAKVSLTHLKTGQLDSGKQLKPMVKVLTANQTMQPFYIVDGALAVNVPQIKMLIQQLKPTDLWIDGAYLLRHENARLGRWEKVTDNAERIKGELAEGFGIPAIISYQFNREATKKKVGAPGVEDIAYTDAIGQLSSLVLGMMQEDSVETLKRRRIQIMKGRSGEIGGFDINWSFAHPNAMDFSQYVAPSISELSYM